MNNSKKYLIAAVGVLVIILFSIFILQALLSRSSPNSQTNPYPTTYPVNQFRQSKSLSNQSNQTVISNSDLSTQQQRVQQSSTQMNELKRKLPLETNDYIMKYSPLLDKIVVTLKTPQADQSFSSWARDKGYPLLVDNNQTTIISDKSMEEVQTPYPTKTPEQQLGTLFTLINLLLQPPSINTQDTTLSPTPSPALLNSSSSLSSTFTSISSQPSGNAYVYYPQCNGPYDKYPMTASCNVCDAGCGPTSVAMILSSYVDTAFTPPKVVDMYKEQNMIGCGTKITDAKNILEQNGVETSDYILGYDEKKYKADEVAPDFKSYIQNGWTIFTLSHFNCKEKAEGCYHFFWITDIDTKNNIIAHDPSLGSRVKTAINENKLYPDPTYIAAFAVRKP